MPIYDFKCTTCDEVIRDVSLPITHQKEDLPVHCGKKVNYFITSPPSVIWNDPIIEPFRPVATPDAPMITTMKAHREYMARNDLVDANDTFAPPTAHEQKMAQEEIQESIDAISGTAEQKEQLSEQGIDSILET